MPKTEMLDVSKLALDRRNFRTVPQRDEKHAINAIIAINPDWFWALMESLLDEGYQPTENIIVQKESGGLIVREGNRRIAAMKMIHGYVQDIEMPEQYATRVAGLTTEWKHANLRVPCAVYDSTEAAIVDRLVSRTHAKGERAGRDKWNAVAKARYARDKNGESAPALDLLETYLKKGDLPPILWTQRKASVS